MQVEELQLPGVKRIQTKIYKDERGFFRELFQKTLYTVHGIDTEFVQDNFSLSHQGTIRGMHFQRTPGQAKLVVVLEGSIFDVVVDIRKDSPTYRQWLGVHLDAEKGEQLFVPVGYAHGFCALSPRVHLCYKVSTPYDPAQEKSFRYDDPTIGIEWPKITPILSIRDKTSPLFDEVVL